MQHLISVFRPQFRMIAGLTLMVEAFRSGGSIARYIPVM